jgi:6-phosphofructokinase 1
MIVKHVAILTGGGDCPGLNAVIRAVVRKSVKHHGWHVWGVKHGWRGLLDGEVEELTMESASGILAKGGTILKTSRTNPLKAPDGARKIFDTLKRFDIDALIAVGGEDTLGVALTLFGQGLKVVGVPKTIDNDLACTDYTFGFDTAVTIATEAIDRLHTTAESHDRVLVVEVMGRNAGWIATVAGMAGGADCILIPEVPFDIEEVCELIRRRHARGKDFSIVVVAEGAKPKDAKTFVTKSEKVDAFGHVQLGGIGQQVSDEIEKRTRFETRATILGHLQRGGSPTVFDRILATRFGLAAVGLVAAGEFGKMVALQGNKIVTVELADAVKQLKTVDMELYELARVFFG